ncbi:MAG TPA: PQQ-dependent sugar dehydrogenase [Planctomycetota bacterium]
MRHLPISFLALLALPTAAQIPNPGQVRPNKGLPSAPASDRLMTSASALTYATHAPGDPNRLFVVEQRGRILILDLNTLTVDPVPFLDIDSRVIGTGNERGLLGLAFHPDYANNGLFYVNYSRNADGDTIVAEYEVTIDPDVADFSSERILLTIDQPQTNHNGGWLDFSPLDGYLYIATGDGGNFCDTGTGHTAGIGNAQDLTTNLLGKMLRIDPLGGTPYGIPASNPFVGIAGDDEIWSYGLRNPWRASFDSANGDLYIGDVGQDIREEISYQPGGSFGGENYGWRCREGDACATAGASGCPTTTGCACSGPVAGLVEPIHAYAHGNPPAPANFVCTVVGGYVYRGSAIPALRGHYLLADYCGNALWSFRVVNGVKTDFRIRNPELSPSLDGFNLTSIVSFGEDANREMYVVTQSAVFKIVPQP